MTLRRYIRNCLDAGMSIESAWAKAEAERWYAPWNYVLKIYRDWKKEEC